MTASLDNQSISEVLQAIIDPEVGLSIVDIGLIYEIRTTKREVHILMTTTSPACPASTTLEDDIRTALLERFGSSLEVHLEITYDPPWDPSMMSDSARTELGW